MAKIADEACFFGLQFDLGGADDLPVILQPAGATRNLAKNFTPSVPIAIGRSPLTGFPTGKLRTFPPAVRM